MKRDYKHIKILLIILLLVFIIVDMSVGGTSNADIRDVEKNTVQAANSEKMELAENRLIKRFYGLNPSDYEGVVLYAPKDNMDVDELLIVKLKNEEQKKVVEKAIDQRLRTQLTSFEGYGAEQVALLNKHVLVIKKDYVFYMVGKNVKEAQKAFVHSL